MIEEVFIIVDQFGNRAKHYGRSYPVYTVYRNAKALLDELNSINRRNHDGTVLNYTLKTYKLVEE